MRCAAAAPSRQARQGLTLVELLVVLVIVGVVLGVAAPGPLAGRTRRPQREEIERLRRDAVLAGTPTTDTIAFGDRTVRATAWPSGLVLIDSLAGVATSSSGEVPDAR